MPSANAQRLALVPHPSTRCEAIRSLSVCVQRRDAGRLLLDYVLEGDLSRIRIPVPREPRRTDGLWKHTCFEAFVTAAAAPGERGADLSGRHELLRAGSISAAAGGSACGDPASAGAVPGYLELNFSPSGEWAAYRFQGYRAGMSAAQVFDFPQVRVQRGPDRLELEAAVSVASLVVPARQEGLDPGAAARGARAALSAVIELDDGTLTYWAHRHPPGRPDFHHPAGFTLELS